MKCKIYGTFVSEMPNQSVYIGSNCDIETLTFFWWHIAFHSNSVDKRSIPSVSHIKWMLFSPLLPPLEASQFFWLKESQNHVLQSILCPRKLPGSSLHSGNTDTWSTAVLLAAGARLLEPDSIPPCSNTWKNVNTSSFLYLSLHLSCKKMMTHWWVHFFRPKQNGIGPCLNIRATCKR